jgi:hypothetical protein
MAATYERSGVRCHFVFVWLVALVLLPVPAWAQATTEEDDALGTDADEAVGEAEPPGFGPGQLPSEPEQDAEQKSGPDLPPTPPAVVPVPVAPPSPFTLTVKGMISGTTFMQDLPTRSGYGGGAIFAPVDLASDKWFLGGDIRQTQLLFKVSGPPVLGDATPTGYVEFDLLGGNQIGTVPGAVSAVTVRDAMGMTVGTGTAASVTSSAQGDESVLPRVRLAYVELNWGLGSDVLRVGQYHNLLLPMVPASASHIGTPLGYGAGAIGWRSPGVTYSHKFSLSDTVNLYASVQLNRNSWTDNVPSCAPTQVPGPMTNCVPGGVSLGEASLLPQVEGRLLLAGPMAPALFPTHGSAPFAWMVYLVGHWDQKDLSGVGADAVAPLDDTLATVAGEAGFKVSLGPAFLSGNAWYGKNTGGLFGHVIQSQAPGQPDVTGFGAWGQIGVGLFSKLSLWAYAGIDKPNEDEARAAGFLLLQNSQLAGMLSYVDGPVVIALEYLRITTQLGLPGAAATPTTPATAPSSLTFTANQIALTGNYFF